MSNQADSQNQLHIIQTDRLLLRKYDNGSMQEVFAKDEAEQLQFFGANSLRDIAKQREMYEGGMTTFNRSFLLFHIILKETEKLIGWCGYHTWYVTHDRAEIGYVIDDESNFGKGIMTEALSAVIDYGFNEMNLHRIEAFVGPQNGASKRLLEKFGFAYEGLLREHYLVDGSYGDSEIHGLLKKEYKSI